MLSTILKHNDNKRMIVLAPHADDEVLGAGGLMAKASRQGWEVHVQFATISGYSSMARGDESNTTSREDEVRAAAHVLGCAGYETFCLGEQWHLRMDSLPQQDIISFIERGLRLLRPAMVLIPCLGHYHQDHRAMCRAAIAALRPAPGGNRPLVPVVLAYGHAHAGWGGEEYNFRPSVFADITDTIEAKLAAMECYRSQVCPEPHPRSPSMLRSHSAHWGAYAGVAYAEAFECIRILD
jgi:LmbE family N-acetylglucosaminyl deacetylase